jgi:hypothetical protein
LIIENFDQSVYLLGVGGPGFQQMEQEIEARLAAIEDDAF